MEKSSHYNLVPSVKQFKVSEAMLAIDGNRGQGQSTFKRLCTKRWPGSTWIPHKLNDATNSDHHCEVYIIGSGWVLKKEKEKKKREREKSDV